MPTNIQTLAATLAIIKRHERPDAPASRIGNAWRELRDAIMRDAPSGAGIDCGTKLDEARCAPNKVVLTCEFHHMNEYGMYSGWTSHTITITPTFEGIDVRVGGRDRNGIKEYLCDVYRVWAGADCPHKFTLPPRS